MKVFVLLFGFVALCAASKEDMIEKHLPSMQKCSSITDKEELIDYTTDCMVDPEDTCGCYLACLMKEYNVMDDQGNVDENKAMEMSGEMMTEMGDEFGVHLSMDQIKVIMHKCLEEAQGESDLCVKAEKLQVCGLREVMAIMENH